MEKSEEKKDSIIKDYKAFTHTLVSQLVDALQKNLDLESELNEWQTANAVKMDASVADVWNIDEHIETDYSELREKLIIALASNSNVYILDIVKTADKIINQLKKEEKCYI